MKKGDFIRIKDLSVEDFIKLHQALEDQGHKMFETTQYRIKWGKPDYDNLKWSNDGICGSNDKGCCKNELPISKFLNLETSYEIY